jgi:adenylate cyclase
VSDERPTPSTYSRADAADRAGVAVSVVDEHIALGWLKPGDSDRLTAGDVRRIVMGQTFVEAGISLEAMTEVVGRGDASMAFLDDPLYDRFALLSTTTFGQLAERTGVPLESLLVIREAIGGAAPGPDDLVREDELRIVPMLEVMAAEGFGAAGVERLLRVMGDCMRRVTDAQAAWWQAEVPGRLAAQGESLGNTGDATAELGARLNAVYWAALTAIARANEQRTWTANILEVTEVALAQAGLYRKVERPPAMCFLDLTGYTRLTAERGDTVAAELASTLSRIVQRTSQQHAGRAVKWLGDGVMFYFPHPGPGVMAALSMVESATDAGLPPAHVGLHAGPVLFQEGDYYGQTVNVASRIADYARPGEVLVSDAVVEAAGEVAAAFTEIGPVELKGVSEAVRLHVARRIPT